MRPAVTRETFLDLGIRYIRDHGGRTFLIASKAGSAKGVSWKATPAEWDAWMSYCREKGLRTDLYAMRGHATMPSRWPHEFDPEIEAWQAGTSAGEPRGQWWVH